MMLRVPLSAVVLASTLVLLNPLAARAQGAGAGSAARQQVVSANPFGLLLGWFNAEYERTVSDSATAGVGGSTFNWDDDDRYDDRNERYVNADVFYRYYPGGRPLQGFAIGAKAGLTSGGGAGPYFGFGIDTNYSWLLGKRDNVYLGLGFGLKRLVGANDDSFPVIIPTIRLINLGVAF